jgi:long-chain acyl-CoA synthetase
MYPGLRSKIRTHQPAFIMAQSGETVPSAELDRRSNRLAHFPAGERPWPARSLRNLHGEQRPLCRMLQRGRTDKPLLHLPQLISDAGRGWPTSSNNSESKVLITSTAKRDVALQAMAQCPRIERCLLVDGPGDGDSVINLDGEVDGLPDRPIPDEPWVSSRSAMSAMSTKTNTFI